MQFFCARRAEKFPEFLQIFRTSWAQNLRDPDAGRAFSDQGEILTRSTLIDVVQYAQRTLAECTQFLCAGRAGFPEILQNFRPIFAQILRDLDAALACNLALERTPTQNKRCNEFLRFMQPRWPSSRSFYARGAPNFFGNFAIFSRDLGAKFA